MHTMPAAIRVAIGVIESTGHVLVGTRSADVPLAGLSEFPGGKCESDESTRACVVRECREETGLMVTPRRHLNHTIQQYDHGTVELDFWLCALSPDLPDLAAATAPFQWIPLSQLPSLDFPSGNDAVLQCLARMQDPIS